MGSSTITKLILLTMLLTQAHANPFGRWWRKLTTSKAKKARMKADEKKIFNMRREAHESARRERFTDVYVEFQRKNDGDNIIRCQDCNYSVNMKDDYEKEQRLCFDCMRDRHWDDAI